MVGKQGGHSHLVPIPCSPASNPTGTSVNYSCLQVNKKDQKSIQNFPELYRAIQSYIGIYYILNKISCTARAILRTFKTSLVPINHEMHSRSYDFLYV